MVDVMSGNQQSPQKLAVPVAQSLTQYEVDGLKAAFTFADGHAYHKMPASLQPVMDDIQHIWKDSSDKAIPELEEEFKRATSRIIKSPVLGYQSEYSLCPTASNSIDIVSTWFGMKGYKVGLIEPAFDNLYLLPKRRDVEVVSIQEEDLVNLDALETKIDVSHLDALFIVSPNNPTGFQMTQEEFQNLCALCSQKRIALIVDTTFRLYSRRMYDEYQILNDNDVDYIVIEDTGKTWPTDDLKVSLMAYSDSLAEEIRMLYEEIYLCTSSFSLGLLTELIEKTRRTGVEKVVWNEVDQRRERLREVLKDTPLTSVVNQNACPLPLEWLDCSATGLEDLELVKHLARSGVAVLPGRFFYWNSQEQHTNNIRINLMRSDDMFEKGLGALHYAMQRLP